VEDEGEEGEVTSELMLRSAFVVESTTVASCSTAL
jgi:hypothetical protein